MDGREPEGVGASVWLIVGAVVAVLLVAAVALLVLGINP
jgi:hypothetical protein